MSPTSKILIAGIGNIFLRDDAFGCEVIKQLLHHSFPDTVKIIDFGIRGLDLTYALLENWDAAILIDAVTRGEAPGTIYVIEPEPPEPNIAPLPGVPMIDAHSMDPAKVLTLVAAMGGNLQRIVLVGCEPAPLNEDDMQMELSPPVAAAVDRAVALVKELVAKISAGETIGSMETFSQKAGEAHADTHRPSQIIP